MTTFVGIDIAKEVHWHPNASITGGRSFSRLSGSSPPCQLNMYFA